MVARVRLWWKKIKAHPIITLLIPFLVALFLTIIIGGYRFNWSWTGLTGDKETYKTLYDWMQLLFIPLVLAVAGFWFNHRERKAAELRAENEQKAAELRADAEREIEQQRAQTERDIAEDNQREVALQAYINEMSELLLDKNLRESTVTDEVRIIARVRTLTVLPRLDGKRKRNLLLFLYDAGLINRSHQIIDISDTNLSEADLSGVNLCQSQWIRDNSNDKKSIRTINADLSGVNLQNANLNGANLSGVKLGAENELELEFGYLT